MNELEEMLKKRIVSNRTSISTKVLADVTYNSIDNEDYACDIYFPPETNDSIKKPAVLLVHGEAPVKNIKSAGQYVSTGELLASEGFLTFAFNHRMQINGAAVNDVLSDMEKMRDFVDSKSEEYNIDKNNLCIWAFSAGMPFGFFNGLNYKSSSVKCLIGYYGLGDFKSFYKLMPGSNNSKMEFPEIINNLESIPSVLIARSGLDNPVINESLDKLIMKFLCRNSRIDIYNHEEGRHAFDILDDNERSHRIIAKTIEFLNLNMKSGER